MHQPPRPTLSAGLAALSLLATTVTASADSPRDCQACGDTGHQAVIGSKCAGGAAWPAQRPFKLAVYGGGWDAVQAGVSDLVWGEEIIDYNPRVPFSSQTPATGWERVEYVVLDEPYWWTCYPEGSPHYCDAWEPPGNLASLQLQFEANLAELKSNHGHVRVAVVFSYPELNWWSRGYELNLESADIVGFDYYNSGRSFTADYDCGGFWWPCRSHAFYAGFVLDNRRPDQKLMLVPGSFTAPGYSFVDAYWPPLGSFTSAGLACNGFFYLDFAMTRSLNAVELVAFWPWPAGKKFTGLSGQPHLRAYLADFMERHPYADCVPVTAGRFRTADSVYHSNGAHACGYASWDHYVWAVGGPGPSAVPLVPEYPSCMPYDGTCILPAGQFRTSDGSYYHSNGEGRACGYTTWSCYVEAGGAAERPMLPRLPETMEYDGPCSGCPEAKQQPAAELPLTRGREERELRSDDASGGRGGTGTDGESRRRTQPR